MLRGQVEGARRGNAVAVGRDARDRGVDDDLVGERGLLADLEPVGERVRVGGRRPAQRGHAGVEVGVVVSVGVSVIVAVVNPVGFQV